MPSVIFHAYPLTLTVSARSAVNIDDDNPGRAVLDVTPDPSVVAAPDDADYVSLLSETSPPGTVVAEDLGSASVCRFDVSGQEVIPLDYDLVGLAVSYEGRITYSGTETSEAIGGSGRAFMRPFLDETALVEGASVSLVVTDGRIESLTPPWELYEALSPSEETPGWATFPEFATRDATLNVAVQPADAKRVAGALVRYVRHVYDLEYLQLWMVAAEPAGVTRWPLRGRQRQLSLIYPLSGRRRGSVWPIRSRQRLDW